MRDIRSARAGALLASAALLASLTLATVAAPASAQEADLKVKVISPANAPEGTITFKVKVRNRGPQAASYELSLDEENMNATCNGPQPWEGLHEFGKLRPGSTRTRKYDVTCSVNGAGAWVEVQAILVPHAQDPRSANNEDTSRTNLQ